MVLFGVELLEPYCQHGEFEHLVSFRSAIACVLIIGDSGSDDTNNISSNSHHHANNDKHLELWGLVSRPFACVVGLSDPGLAMRESWRCWMKAPEPKP